MRNVIEQMVHAGGKEDSAERTEKSTVGFVARGEHDENSDIDICIKLQEPNYFIILDIKEDLEKILSTKVDVISLGAIMRNFFRKSLEQDAIYI